MAAPRALIHNWRLKASALGLSIFLWALVQTEPSNDPALADTSIEAAGLETIEAQ